MHVPLLLSMALAAAGPALDPVDGTVLTARDRALLPSGRHAGSIMDLWLVNVTSMQTNGGGIARFDPLYLSSHGRSWTQARHRLNGLDMTDPARDGEPMVALPFSAWDALHVGSLWTSQPGLDWRVDAAPPPLGHVRAQAGLGADLGGGTWVPQGFMDREPASDFGAPAARRSLRSPLELEMEARGHQVPVRAHVEYVRHARQYLTLPDLDESESVAALLAVRLQPEVLEYFNIIAAVNGLRRSYADAQFRLPLPATLAQRSDGAWLQAEAALRPERGLLTWQGGVGYRRETLRPHGDQPLVRDIEGEWLWMARPRFGETSERALLSSRLAYEVETGGGHLDIVWRGRLGTVSALPRVPGGVVAATYQRGSGNLGVSQTVYDPAREANEWVGAMHLEADWRGRAGPLHLGAHAGLDHGAIGTAGRTRYADWSPALGLMANLPLGEHEVYALLRREPEVLNQHVATFLSPQRPSGRTYAWTDDGDGVPQANERGALLSRTGARYHAVDDTLERPASYHFAIGYHSAPFGPFRFRVNGITRFLVAPYTVRLDEASEAGYTRRRLLDPEDRKALVSYARDLDTAGRETYILTNQTRPSAYVGAEIQLYTFAAARWFFNLGAVGYWSFGTGAQFGSYPDRNDSGTLGEASADPNQRINDRGRFDADRAFGINLLWGIEPIDNLMAAMAIKYRDGQPFARILVAEDLPQGPTPVMGTWRGHVRYTFQMTIDLRLQYTLALGNHAVRVFADVYNLLGSGTEVAEDPRTGGTWRDPLEMMPGRMFFAGLELVWQ